MAENMPFKVKDKDGEEILPEDVVSFLEENTCDKYLEISLDSDELDNKVYFDAISGDFIDDSTVIKSIDGFNPNEFKASIMLRKKFITTNLNEGPKPQVVSYVLNIYNDENKYRLVLEDDGTYSVN